MTEDGRQRTGEQKIRLQEIGRTGYQENREFRRNQKLKGHRHKCTSAQEHKEECKSVEGGSPTGTESNSTTMI